MTRHKHNLHTNHAHAHTRPDLGVRHVRLAAWGGGGAQGDRVMPRKLLP